MYEVLPTEPLHDVKENISNIIIEISAHLSDDAKKLCEETLSLVSGTKDQLHGSDYCEICIVLAKQLRGEHCLKCKICLININFIFIPLLFNQLSIYMITFYYFPLHRFCQ